MAFTVYGGAADAAGYDEVGVADRGAISGAATSTPALDSLSGTNFIRFFTGTSTPSSGPSRLGGFLFFSWIGFWGLFLFYGRSRSRSRGGRRRLRGLIFFLPSLLYWPSSIGKEAWMMLALGDAAFGAAKSAVRVELDGLPMPASGCGSRAWSDPMSRACWRWRSSAGYLIVRKPRKELRHLAAVVKAAGLVAVIVVAAILW